MRQPAKINQTLTLENLIAFIRYNYSIPEKKIITEESLIEDDFGITGDDGIELLENIEQHFSISFSNEDDSLRDVFDLKEDEYLFHSEGCNPFGWLLSLFFKNEEKVIKLTVDQLFVAATKAKRI